MGVDRLSSIIFLTEYALSIDKIGSNLIHNKFWLAVKGPSVLRFTLSQFLGHRLLPWLLFWEKALWCGSMPLLHHLFKPHLVDGEIGFAAHLPGLSPQVMVGPKVGKSRIQMGKLGPLDFLAALNQDMLRPCPLAGCQGALLGALVSKVTPYAGWRNRHDIEYWARKSVRTRSAEKLRFGKGESPRGEEQCLTPGQPGCCPAQMALPSSHAHSLVT